jgi:signal transduction histidine kinase
VLGVVMAATGSSILFDAFGGKQLWGELFEVPLMAAMFLAMVWHARRRMEALAIVERRAEERRSLLERQERFIQDGSHELHTPVTIAAGTWSWSGARAATLVRSSTLHSRSCSG